MAAYLVGGQRPGRLSPAADGPMLALALVGTVHHLLRHGHAGTDVPAELIRRLVAALVPAPEGGSTAVPPSGE
ncbi:hypothetical protein ACFY00_36930 [Kitasatospora sp. NPDC001540]|uniref:hypothetical protein n=1 Tax=Kitasatospora sp. NPDC001540 TaxID=3364014 RepID=UPI00367696D5